MKGFSLDKYVVSRDPSGALKKVIIKESFSPDTLDPDVLAIAGFDPAASDGSSQIIDIYTCFYKGRKSEKGPLRWMTYQEVNEVIEEVVVDERADEHGPLVLPHRLHGRWPALSPPSNAHHTQNPPSDRSGRVAVGKSVKLLV